LVEEAILLADADVDYRLFDNDDNGGGGVIEYVGQQPIFTTIQSVSPEYFDHLDRLWQRAFELAGISELSATSRKPAGLNSGRAIIEFSDIETERFAIIGQDLERFYLNIAEQQIDLAKQISDETGSYAVIASDGREAELIDWSEVDMERDSFLMQTYPVAFLPQTPSGKWEIVAQMIESGFIGQDEAAELLDYPDLESVTDRQNAPVRYADLLIENMLEKGIYTPPDPHSNLALNVKLITFALLQAETNNAPEERLDLMRQYVADADAMLAEAQAALAPPPVPGAGVEPGLAELPPDAGVPPGAPGAIETSQSLPQPQLG
jgi:hypothetical protein